MATTGTHYLTAAAALSLLACGAGESGEAPKSVRANGPSNVLIVSLDTLRADRLGAYGNEEIETPHLDRLAAEGTVFEQAFTPVPSTLPSHCSIMTGSYPVRHGVHDNGVYYLEDEAVTVAEHLADQGYATAAFVAAFVLDPQFNLDQGFDVYDAEMELPLFPDGVDLPESAPQGVKRWAAQMGTRYQRRADTVTDRALAWLEQTSEKPKPFFLWVHYFDAHQPYQAPEPWATKYDPSYRGPLDGDQATWWQEVERAESAGRPQLPDREWRHMVARYDAEVSFVDAEAGRLFDTLRRHGQWDDTLVIVVGDHGESFGEHGQPWEHNASVFDEVLRVPLIVRRPDGVGRGRRVAGLVRTIDLAPTIVEWLELPGWADIQGESLLPLTESDDAKAPGEIMIQALRNRQLLPQPFSLLGLRTEDSKVVLRIAASGKTRRRSLYDLERDPKELDPIAGKDAKQRLESLVAQLRRRDAEFARNGALPMRQLDRVTSEALEALGYIEK